VLEYFALFLLFFVGIVLFYGIIVIHDIPYEIAHHRNHPHQDAIHAAGWVSIFTLHAMWPFLWIWAMAYQPGRGWGFDSTEKEDSRTRSGSVDELLQRVAELERSERERRMPRVAAAARAMPAASAIDAGPAPNVAGALETSPTLSEPKRRSG
jgi:hypothetical protein